MRPYEKVEAWASAHRLCARVYRSTEHWPKREWYGLSSQLRRSAFSIAANIVEGHAKRGQAELGFNDDATSAELETLLEDTGRKLWGLMKSLDDGRSR